MTQKVYIRSMTYEHVIRDLSQLKVGDQFSYIVDGIIDTAIYLVTATPLLTNGGVLWLSAIHMGEASITPRPVKEAKIIPTPPVPGTTTTPTKSDQDSDTTTASRFLKIISDFNKVYVNPYADESSETQPVRDMVYPPTTETYLEFLNDKFKISRNPSTAKTTKPATPKTPNNKTTEAKNTEAKTLDIKAFDANAIKEAYGMTVAEGKLLSALLGYCELRKSRTTSQLEEFLNARNLILCASNTLDNLILKL